MFAITDDQVLFAQTTARFLDGHQPLGAPDHDPARWRQGAELGWTSLLVPEALGGGSISGNGLADLLIVAHQFGTHAAPGPLFGCNLVAAALARWGDDHHHGLLAELLAGTTTATWAHQCAGGPTRAASARLVARPDGDGWVVDGDAGTVEAADLLLVAVHHDDTNSHVLIPLDQPGVTCRALRSIDRSRRYVQVAIDGLRVGPEAVVGPRGAASEHDAHLTDLLGVMVLGELAGTLERTVDITTEWTLQRHSFGRPLGSYQEIKHRMADHRTELEAAEAVAARAGALVGTGAPGATDWVCAGMAHVGQQAPEVIQDCIQIHGGIGVTVDLDLHHFLRRAALDAAVYGPPHAWARHLGALTIAAEGATR